MVLKMKLTQLFAGERQIEEAGRPGIEDRGASSKHPLRTLAPGQTIRGEILSRNGKEALVKLQDSTVLNAKIDTKMNLEAGRILTFEVKSSGSLLTLSPLFENTSADANLLKALEMASLPVSETTVSITRQLMEAGLPIDRAMLQQVYREVNGFPEASVLDVVDLHRLGVAVNESNLSQLQAYKNFNYQLEGGLNQLLQEFTGLLAHMLQTGSPEKAAGLWREIFLLLSENKSLFPAGGQEGSLEETEGTAEQYSGQLTEGEAAAERTEAMGFKEAAKGKGIFYEEALAGDVRVWQEEASEAGSQTGLGPFGEEAETLEGSRQLLRGGELLRLVNRLFTAEGIPGREEMAALKRILSGREFQKALTEGLRELWTLSAEEIGESKQVQEFYGRLGRQLKALAGALEEAGQTGSQAFKTAGGLSQNLDFLQQINQAYTYVQLPLRLQQGRANGELYVFTNKKNLASREGQVSALLHLDMEHLGAVDVYVAMQQERVSTRFYVQEEEILDFLEEHMELLTERLKSRGYDCSLAMEVRNSQAKKEGGVMELLKRQGHMPVSQYAFDMRA